MTAYSYSPDVAPWAIFLAMAVIGEIFLFADMIISDIRDLLSDPADD